MRRPMLPLLALSISCGGTVSSVPRTRLTEKDIMQRSAPAIVRIEAAGDRLGTGFILDKTGLIATNLHVVAGTANIQIKLYDGTQYAVLQIAGFDAGRDLALLRIQPTKPLPTLPLGDSDAMEAGDKIVAIGNPLGVFDYSVSNGLISQRRPVCSAEEATAHNKLAAKPGRTAEEDSDLAKLRCTQELTLLQISASISQGSSGGPLFNQFGEVVGITTAIITAGQNINLAVPANYLKPMVARPKTIGLEQFAKDTNFADETGGNPDDGPRIVREVPDLEAKVFDGCGKQEITDLVKDISEAIETGAPLYNEGNHKACFQIYEGVGTKWEHDAPCSAVRSTFGDGMLRAKSKTTFKEKAWVMRDTFDGLLAAAEKWAHSTTMQAPPPSTKPPKK